MKKKITVMLVLVMLVSVFAAAGTASAAEAEADIAVFVDGEEITFETAPFIESGTTLVPFRTIFEKLGMSVKWDPKMKAVTGKKEGLVIELVIGSKTAVVNGEKKTLSVAPKVVNQATFVPLRFISENAQREVSWDPVIREIYIADATDQILNLFLKQYGYMNAENLAGYMFTIDPNSDGYAITKSTMAAIFETYDLESEADITVVELDEKAGKAVVETVQTTVKIDGPDYQDTKTISYHTVVRVNGEWKVNASEITFVDYLKADLYKKGEVALNDTERKAVTDVIEQHRKYLDDEDLAKDKELYATDYAELDSVIEQAKQLAAAYELTFVFSDIEFVSATADKAIVKVTSTVKDSDAKSDFQPYKAEYAITMKKGTDGKWKFAASDVLTVEVVE